jgi:hypothetical protein
MTREGQGELAVPSVVCDNTLPLESVASTDSEHQFWGKEERRFKFLRVALASLVSRSKSHLNARWW